VPPPSIDLESFTSARRRIADHVVETPVASIRASHDVSLKLESLQVSGSFKARGALSKVLSLDDGDLRRGIVTASGGNHGLAVAYAGHVKRAPTVVYLPSRTPEDKAKRIEQWGARVVRAGDVWDEAHAAALDHAAREGLTYVHPFADPAVISGQGTIALEVFEQIPDVDLFVVAIGGGGLVAGVAAAAKLLRPSVRIIGVEPEGAPTLYESLRAGEVIELARIDTAAGTLAPRRSDPLNFEIIRETVDSIVLVSDEEMKSAARFLLTELGIGAELSGAAALAAVLSGKADPTGAQRPCVLVCGAGKDGVPCGAA
jgi:threonine dehydratase